MIFYYQLCSLFRFIRTINCIKRAKRSILPFSDSHHLQPGFGDTCCFYSLCFSALILKSLHKLYHRDYSLMGMQVLCFHFFFIIVKQKNKSGLSKERLFGRIIAREERTTAIWEEWKEHSDHQICKHPKGQAKRVLLLQRDINKVRKK